MALSEMKITGSLFEAGLKCLTRCFFLSLGEHGAGNAYADWVTTKRDSYRREGIKGLTERAEYKECISDLPGKLTQESAVWQIAADVLAHAQNLESCIHSIEKIPPRGGSNPARFIPIRFISFNKLTKYDKLLLAFDALVLSKMLDREVSIGKIIHGDNHTTLKVNTSSLAKEVRRLIKKIDEMFSNHSPPDLVLKRYCGECEFQDRCRLKAIEKDDISLLAGMTEKERRKYNSKGIFTITQLSYTFRPRRRSNRRRDKQEKYHHSIKALAIREKKIHIVGNPEIRIDATPIYLDVEGIPDRNFYYLIGMRIGNNHSVVQHSLWADNHRDELTIWRDFLAILSSIEKPVLVHYGSYESSFLKHMCERYGGPPEGTASEKAVKESINLLTVIYAQIYFPGFGNGLKDTAGFLGYIWTDVDLFGPQSIAWRHLWEQDNDKSVKEKLLRYNAQDCEALKLLTDTIREICSHGNAEPLDHTKENGIVRLDSAQFLKKSKWQRFTSPVASLELINSAAHWNYQRDRVYARTGEVKQKPKKRLSRQKIASQPGKVIIWESTRTCPRCNRSYYYRNGQEKTKNLHEILFGHHCIKLRSVKYVFQTRFCRRCGTTFGMPDRYKFIKKYGWNLIAYFIYHVVDLGLPQRKIVQGFNRLFGFGLNRSTLHNLKIRTAAYYAVTKEQILDRIVRGSLLHVDETRANIKGQSAFVWVLASHKEVVYILSESREGEIAHKLLADFKGVLVSDFYTAYDSINCPQQKCLIHLMRDLNDDILDNPFDEQLKQIVVGFGDLLKQIIETVDRYGLKQYFLKKYLIHVDKFFCILDRTDYQSEVAVKCKDRFEKNRDKLFTFLRYDGVPWNNNNAEHAIKAFAGLRDVIAGSSTVRGIDEYLTLLSVCQTCKYQNIDFLDFLRTGEKDIHAFAETKHSRRRGDVILPMRSK
jgi:predicted RecB family nuclease